MQNKENNMRINKISVFLTIATITLAIMFIKNKSTPNSLYTTDEAIALLNSVYDNKSGFSINQDERTFIEEHGGAPTYGEIKPESLAVLLNDLQLSDKDILYDLGSGIGKVCAQVALTTPARAVGVELSTTRHTLAQEAKKALLDQNILKDNNKLKFIEGNILEVPCNDGTVFFLCSTCFSPDLMEKLVDKLSTIKGARILTLKDLPANNSFVLQKTYTLPMSWSNVTNIYYYVPAGGN